MKYLIYEIQKRKKEPTAILGKQHKNMFAVEDANERTI
jgi:hypothetical protein